MTDYSNFFSLARGSDDARPFPYQERLGTEPWPELLDIPTGLGKTAAILVAWAFKRTIGDAETPRRLVYCLPMRSLVEQTVAEAEAIVSRIGRPIRVHAILGGADSDELRAFLENPEGEAVLVGTQDMLLSRALNRGYGMSRFQWPIAFGLLHSDAMWVFDETQLMGVGVETSAQLDGLRRKLGTMLPCRSLWVSATLGRSQIATIDHPVPASGFPSISLDRADLANPTVDRRVRASKTLRRASFVVPAKSSGTASYASEVADLALKSRKSGMRTIVIVNRVVRAQAIFEALRKKLGSDASVCLLHSRFRRTDRLRAEAAMRANVDGIVVATQAIEAGVDVTSATMITELSPWSSFVQRIGRLNRYGECDAAECHYIDFETLSDDAILPYEAGDLEESRRLMSTLEDIGPGAVREIRPNANPVVRPVLRRRDLIDLFDTTPELLGQDLDVARFIRDSNDLDVSVAWRAFDGAPPDDIAQPERDELCSISIGAARTLIDRLSKAAKDAGPTSPRAYIWDPLGEPGRRWVPVYRPIMGRTILLSLDAGAYDDRLGFTGNALDRPSEVAFSSSTISALDDDASADPSTSIGTWVSLTDHLGHVADEAVRLVSDLRLDPRLGTAVVDAARFHDVGKAHPVFQKMMASSNPEQLWAKSDGAGRRAERPGFRHEWASALAWLQTSAADVPNRDLVAYLVAAHHGKVRVSIRSTPVEREAPNGVPFARGVWHGDELPEVRLPNGEVVPALALDATPVRLGEGCWLELTTALRDAPALGPFRLAFLETLVRIADWRASRGEQASASLADERMPIP